MNLTEKYRPNSIQDLVLPPDHGAFEPALSFLASPFPSSWLLTGKSGTGKSSLARLMAAAAAHSLATLSLVGPDLTSNYVRDLQSTVAHAPLWGGLYAVIVDEADEIPLGGQVRLLHLLEHAPCACFVFTSNEKVENFETRFLSRLLLIQFTTHGLFEPACEWIQKIATREGIPMDQAEAGRLVRSAKNNLRSALNLLQTRIPAPLRVPALSSTPLCAPATIGPQYLARQ